MISNELTVLLSGAPKLIALERPVWHALPAHGATLHRVGRRRPVGRSGLRATAYTDRPE